jgi:steroid 5-alpha reductase family enzyme
MPAWTIPELLADVRSIGLGTLAVGALIFVLWLLHLPRRNASIMDVGWAAGLVLIAVLYALEGHGNRTRVALLTAMGAIWGLRLALHLFLTRVLGHPEEGRYVELRRQWGSRASFNFLLFFEAQAVLCGIVSLPFAIVAHDAARGMTWSEYAGATLWVVAMLGEIAADAQLAAFKRDPMNQGRVCQTGLWRYSRHPNYFFEWLVWVSFAVVAIPSPLGVLGLISPAVMLFLLLRVSGIPPAEAQALRTRGEEYRVYQRTTSRFIPWLPQKGSGRKPV